MSRITAAKKSAILLLGVLLVLLAVSFLPFGSNYGSGSEKAAVKEKTILFQQIQELNNLPPAVDEKISPVLKDEANEAIYLSAVAGNRKDAEAARKVEFLAKSSKDISGEIEDAGGEILNIVDSIDGQNRYYAVRADADKVAELAAEEDVARLSPRTVAYATLDQSVPMIKADAFWAGGYRGSGVRVAVLDTGIDKTHLMLSGRVVAERDFSETGSANDFHGHGTHVAGTIAGSKSAGGLYDGVAPDALLLNAKVLNNSGRGTIDYILAGMKWALDPDLNPATDDGAKIISMSLGMNSAHDADFENEIKSVVDKGVVVVVASGNCGPGCIDATCGGCKGFRGVTSPGSSPSVITVGAVDKSNSVAYFSGGGIVPGVGVKPDFVAPGVDIKSSVPGNGYAALQGTSMATPHVSGAVALVLSKNSLLKPDEVRRIFEKTSVDMGDVGKDISYGFGMIDMGRAFIFREGIEFATEVEKLIISGNPQGIKVTVFDDVLIKSVSAVITRPESSKATVLLSSSDGKVFTASYSDTMLLGIYIVDVTVEYGGSGGSAGTDGSSGSGTSTLIAMQTVSFKVTSLIGDFGNLEELNLSSTQFLSTNFSANLTFANTAAIDLNFSALLQLFRLNGDVMEAASSQEIRLLVLPVAENSKASSYANSRLGIAAGNYTLRILADYDAGSLVNETNISVVDDMPPIIVAVDYSSQLTGLSPQTFLVSLSEHGSVGSVALSVNKSEIPVPVNYTLSVPGRQGSEKELAATLFNGTFEAGNYRAVLGICDEYGNCAESSSLEFSISACDGKNVLVVKTYDSESVFESAVSSQAGLCLATLNRSTTGSPPAQYLGIFDAVIWTTGTDIININSADAAALADYYRNGGRVLVEGSDVAFRHGNDELMNSVLHAGLDSDIGFTIASADGNLSGLNITLERPHPVVAGLLSPLPFNVTQDPFPDSVRPYNGSVALATWNGTDIGGPAIVAYESDDGKSKSVFLPFYIGALGQPASEALAWNAVKWLVGDGKDDVSVGSLSHGFLVENEAALFAVSVASAAVLESPPKISVFLDNIMANEGELDLSTLSDGVYTYPFELSLPLGGHSLRIVASSDFSLPEPSYVNNVKDFALQVYPKMSDLVVLEFSYSYDEPAAAISMVVNVSNLGGTAASSGIAVYLDGVNVESKAFDAGIGEMVAVPLSVNTNKGAYGLRLAVDEDNSVEEFNESNNELQQKIYLCSKEKVLVVDDNDAAFFSTPEPSSSDEFLDVLRNAGYCVEVWDEKAQGVPGSSGLNNFEVVVWSAGDYFNGTISYEDELAIGNYSGGLLVEGSDVGLDHSGSSFLQELAAAAFSSDLLLNESQNESLVLRNHSITANISNISIGKEKSPYPDSLEIVDAEVVAEWQSGNAAITAKTAATTANAQGPYKTAYYAFSVDGVTDASAMEQLVLNTVQWLLVKPNSPPLIQNLGDNASGEISATAIKVTMSEDQTRNFSVLASDPDGDPLTYTWLLNGSLVSDKYYYAFSPKYNESGSYNLTVIVSDGQAEARAEIIITVLDTMDCDPEKQTMLCPSQSGVCSGSNQTCDSKGKWPGCTAATYLGYSSKYEANENSCDGFDNDCDGSADEGFGNVDNDSLADCVDDDNDNDGTKDDEDDLIGNESSINFTGDAGDEKKLKIGMEDSEDEKEKAQKVKWVRINHSDKPLLQFRFNFSKGTILLRNLTIEKQKNSGKEGFTLVRGLDLKGETKQVFVDRLVSGSNAVCVKDKEVSQISEISSGCDNEGEGLLTCEAAGAEQTSSGLSCRLTSGNGQFQIYGLKHSAVMEACTDADLDSYLPTGCSGGSDCNDSNASINPAAAELCNGVDDNCNGQIDENRVCNTAPELQSIGNKTVSENGTLSFAVAATDNEGDNLTYNATKLPQGATFDNATAAFAWTPTFTQAGVYTVAFNVSDGLAHDYEKINLTVTNTDRAPVFETVGNKTVMENAALSFTVGVTDPDGDSLAQLFVSVPERLASAQFSSSTKEFKWTPTFDDSGSYAIWFTASDGQLSTNEFVNVTVVNVNRAPRFENLTNSTALENSTLKFFVNASDPDKDSLTVTLVEIPAKFSSSATFDGREFALPLGFEDSGSYSVSFAASDGQVTVAATVNFTVTNVNRAPHISSVSGNLTVNETETVTAIISATDSDGDLLTYAVNNSVFSQPTPGSFEWSTDFSSAGAYVLLATASDGSATAQFEFTATVKNVNRAPRFENLTNQTVLENATLSFFANATDPDNDALWLLSGVPGGLTGAEFNPETMQFSWAPTFDDSGTYTVAFTAGDGQYDIYAELNITVLNVNVAPAITNIHGRLTANETENVTLIINASDNDGDALAYSLNDSRFVQDTAANSTFNWKTGYEDAGVYVVLASASDGSLTTTATATIKVDNVNRAPALAAAGNKTVNENSTLKFKVTASDPDNDAVKITIAKPHAAEGLAFDSLTSDVVWAPTFEQASSYTLAITASDGNLSDSEEINITVLNVNRAPAITLVLVDPPELVMGEGEAKTFAADVSDADNDAVMLAWKVNGETVSTGPELEFAPKYNESGEYAIELAVSDYASTTMSVMTLTVQDTLDCGTGQTKPCPMQQGVCAGSFETCAAPGNWLGCGASNYGSSYVAEEKFCSSEPNVNSCHALCDGFDNDCDGSADEERACNTAPQLRQMGNRTVKENETLEFTIPATDAEPDAFVFSASELPQGSMLDTTLGTSLGTTAGKFSWVPGFEQAGQYTVTFAVSDGLQDDSETVNITVKNVNRPPEVTITIDPPGQHMNEGSYKLLKAEALDLDGDALSYKWFMNGKLVSMYNLYYFSANWAAGDNNTLYEVVLNVSDGNITASVTTQLIVSNTQLCKPKEIGTAPCGSSTGMCKQGTQTRTCGNDYMWGGWGECVGGVMSVAEDCGTWEDDDCDGKVNEECQPDLAAAWMSFKVSDFAPGSFGEVSMSALDNASPTMRIFYYGEIMNTGKDASPPSFAVWYLNDRFFGRGYLPRVDAGGKVPVQMMTVTPYQGANVAELVLDADGKISETSENNNDMDFTIDVNYNETYKESAKKLTESYYGRFPTKEECEKQGKCW